MRRRKPGLPKLASLPRVPAARLAEMSGALKEAGWVVLEWQERRTNKGFGLAQYVTIRRPAWTTEGSYLKAVRLTLEPMRFIDKKDLWAFCSVGLTCTGGLRPKVMCALLKEPELDACKLVKDGVTGLMSKGWTLYEAMCRLERELRDPQPAPWPYPEVGIDPMDAYTGEPDSPNLPTLDGVDAAPGPGLLASGSAPEAA